MKIMYIPSDMDGPGFYRCLSPGNQLAKRGWTVALPEREIVPLEDRFNTNFDWDHNLPPSADLYVFQQRKEREWHEEGVPRMRSLGAATSMDIDDEYVNLPPYNPAFWGTHQYRRKDGVIRNRKMRRDMKLRGIATTVEDSRVDRRLANVPNRVNKLHLMAVIASVDLLTVSTPALANSYSRYSNNIKVIRNYVDWDIWQDITPQYEVEREGGRIRIGWTGLLGYRTEDLKILQRVIPKILRAHPEVDFVTNEEKTHDFLNVPYDRRVTIGKYDFNPVTAAHCLVEGQVHVPAALSSDLPLGRMTAVMDIGLVPLAMNALNEGKSHLKGMEYNAAGIPFIASPSESYKDYWADGINGVIAEKESDWEYHLEMMITDHECRRSRGEWGRKKAEKHSIQNNWQEWDTTYKQLLGGEHHKVARRSISFGAVQKTSEMGPFLKMVDDLKPKVVVEIGTATGGTFWSLAQYADDDALMVSIDIPAGSPIDMKGGKDVYYGRDRKRLAKLIKPTQQLCLIDLNSQLKQTEVALRDALKGQQIDLLFIDGDHRYDGVKHDYETYSKYVRKGGIIAFHDIVEHTDKRVEVDMFWNELYDTHPQAYEFRGKESWGAEPWGGIGVIYA